MSKREEETGQSNDNLAEQRGGEPQNSKHAELIERINQNLNDYYNMLEGYRTRELIDMTRKISAMSDAHLYMTGHNFNDSELDFYLQFQNPLEVVADAWCERNADIKDMRFVLDNIYDKQDALVDYPLMTESDLRRYMDDDLNLYHGKPPKKTNPKTLEEKLKKKKKKVKERETHTNNNKNHNRD
jgi:hypothetical protein